MTTADVPLLPMPASLALAAGAALLLAQASRVAEARTLASQAPAAFTRPLPHATRRVLLVGDSTGAGVGCEAAHDSLAAHLARDFPQAEVRNLCFNGATVGDTLRVVRELPADAAFDLVLVFAGGNDVLHRTSEGQLAADAVDLLALLRPRAHQVVWAGMANVGLAPLFLPPFSWWMTARTRRINRLLARVATASGARFVDFFREKGACPFAAEPARFYARDRVHPSAAAYAHCYSVMQPLVRHALA